MIDKINLINEYYRIRDFFIAACEDDCIPITPQLGLSKQIENSESIYFEIHNSRILNIKIRYDAHNFPDNVRYDYYFSEFPDPSIDDVIPYLAIDLIGSFSDLSVLWKLRNLWLNDCVDQENIDETLKVHSILVL